MSKNNEKQRRVEKHKHSHGKKNRDRHTPHHKSKKHSMSPPAPAASSSTDAASSSSSRPYIEQGPHGSISVKALPGSSFLYARNGSYAIREDAYIKEVTSSSSGERTAFMNCQIYHGILIRPNTRQAKFQYPDGTFMHCVPVSDVKVLSMQGVYKLGRGREYINSASEVYGRDSVLLRIKTTIVNKLKKHASRVYANQYQNDNVVSFGQPDEHNPDVTLVPSTVRSHAHLVAKVRGAVLEKRISKVTGWDNMDIYGDVLIALKYVRNLANNSAELVFELQDVMVRRGAAKLFPTSSSAN